MTVSSGAIPAVHQRPEILPQQYRALPAGRLRIDQLVQIGVAGQLSALGGRTTRGDQGRLTRGERLVPQSEVIRAILLEG